MKQHKHTLRQIRAMAFENGCVWGAAIIAMGYAIQYRTRGLCKHGAELSGFDECLECWVNPHAGEPECAGCGCGLHLHEGACTMGAHGFTCPCPGFVTADDRSVDRG